MTSRASNSTSLTDLPHSEQDRLAQILDGYLVAIEQGRAVSPDELLAEHPEDAPFLRSCLSGLNLLCPTASHEDSETALSGRVIGDYRLVREVGRGGMGVVYEAEQLSLKRRVALKVLPQAAASDEKQRRRFLVESQTAASIEHPNILPVFCIGQEGGTHFYAMRLVEGPSLGEWIGVWRDGAETIAVSEASAREDLALETDAGAPESSSNESYCGSLDVASLKRHVERIAHFGAQAADALHAAHEHGVVHRDVKPSNLLIEGDDRLWVTDFGLARCREGSDLTRSGDLLGTLKYMSPEQKAGSVIDHRSDVYSLGLTLYEAAVLRWPYPQDPEGLAALTAKGAPPVRRWDRRIPVDFDTVIMKALADAPEDRYPSAAELADDLRRFLNQEPIRAKPPGPVRRVSKWARRHQPAVVSGVAALFVAAVAMSVALVMVSRENRRAEASLAHATAQIQKQGEVLDSFGSRLAEQLAAIPGAQRVRHQLLKETLSYYRELVDVAGDDPALRADVALAYGKLGGLTARLGDQSKAVDYYRRGIEAIEHGAAGALGEREERRRLAVLWSNLGGLHREMGATGAARESLRTALGIQQELISSSPEAAGLAAELAATHSANGLLLLDRGENDDASAEFAKAVELLERARDDPSDEAGLRLLAVAYCNNAAAREAERPAEAKHFLGDAIAVQKRLVAGSPLNLVYQGDLARSYNTLGRLHARLRQWSEAQSCYTSANEIQRRLVEVAPLVVLYRRDLAVSQNNLGMVIAQTGDAGEATELFDHAARLQRRLLAQNPEDVQALTGLGGTLNNAGVLRRDKGEIDAALELFAQAVASQQRAHEASPNDRRVRQLLANHLQNYADCSRRLGLDEQAAEAEEMAQNVLDAEPENHHLTPVVGRSGIDESPETDVRAKGRSL